MTGFRVGTLPTGQEMGVYNRPIPAPLPADVTAIQQYMQANPGVSQEQAAKQLQATTGINKTAQEVAALSQENQTRADLSNRGSKYFDKAPDPNWQPGQIQFSMGDVIDAPGGNPRVSSNEALQDIRVVGDKGYLPPPEAVPYFHPEESDRAPYQKMNYTLNDAGRAAYGAIGEKAPAPVPAPVSPEIMRAILENGGGVDEDGGYTVKPPGRGANGLSSPQISALTGVARDDYRDVMKELDAEEKAMAEAPAPVPVEPPNERGLLGRMFLGDSIGSDEFDGAVDSLRGVRPPSREEMIPIERDRARRKLKNDVVNMAGPQQQPQAQAPPPADMRPIDAIKASGMTIEQALPQYRAMYPGKSDQEILAAIRSQ